jgi:hypothetical protein
MRGLRILLGCFLLSALWLPLQASAQSAAPSARYFDGHHWRQLWMSDTEVAEVGAAAGSEALVRSVAPGAQPLHQGRLVRIWRLDQISDPKTVTRSLNAAGERRFTPVFHLSPRGGSRLVPLGNIVVRFKQETDPVQMSDWASRHSLSLLKAMSIPRTYLFAAADGMDALAKAEQIQLEGEVDIAVPQWWREAFRR